MRHSDGLRAASGTQNTAWNISAAQFNGTPVNYFSVKEQALAPQDLFFKPDGTKVYVMGLVPSLIYEYDLSTPWDISTASLLQSFSILAQESFPTGLFFKPDGTKAYVMGLNTDRIYEYNLSTAWNISTINFLQSFSISPQEGASRGLSFKPDGTKAYVIGSNQRIYEYNLSTAWNISTASFLQSFSVAAQETSPQGLFFKPDGTKVYIAGNTGDDISEYNLSTAWDISTASYVQFFQIFFQETSPTGLFFKPDGAAMYIIGSDADRIAQYDLSTAWNISTASFTYPTTNYFRTAGLTQLQDIFFKPDGTKVYTIDAVNDRIYEYNLSTAWNVSTASLLQSFSVAGQEFGPSGLFFKPDGTKAYITGYDGDRIYEYNLSTAWDISTASFLQSFSVAGQETAPQGLFFRPDGIQVYIIGSTGDDINAYTLSTAWNISTAVFSQLFSVAAQDTEPSGLFFKPDGTRVYVTGNVNDRIYEYNLSTAWNVSTASFRRSFSVAEQGSVPTGLFFKPDGTKVYVIDSFARAMWSYDL
jgi:DNA-binding beta-propeller fold protein YncE